MPNGQFLSHYIVAKLWQSYVGPKLLRPCPCPSQVAASAPTRPHVAGAASYHKHVRQTHDVIINRALFTWTRELRSGRVNCNSEALAVDNSDSNNNSASSLDDLLPAVLADVDPKYSGQRVNPSQPSVRVPKLASTARRHSYWYDAIIDIMLAEPGIEQRELARRFGKSEPTMRMLLNSDMFKNRYDTRRRELNERMADEISQETSTVALLSLREVTKRLRDNPAAIPIGQLTEISHSTLDRLGYGQKSVAAPTQVNVNVSVPASVVAEARDKLRQVQSDKLSNVPSQEIIDITPPIKDAANG